VFQLCHFIRIHVKASMAHKYYFKMISGMFMCQIPGHSNIKLAERYAKPETGSNRRRRPFQGPLPMDLSDLKSEDIIETKTVSAVPI
jgi:hypothetical protein